MAETRERRTDTPKFSLDMPRTARSRRMPRLAPDPDAFGRFAERFARYMGTPQFLVYMTLFCVLWLGWNTIAPESLQFDPKSLNYTLLTLILSLQASYAAPLILLAQNRQDDRDRVQIEQDRGRNERNLADTEYLTRELAALRVALREVATRDYVRAEMRSLLEDIIEAQHEFSSDDDSADGEKTPEKVKEKIRDKRDRQRGPRTQQIPKVQKNRADADRREPGA
ncbi:MULTISPECIES: DUF1003 domain-containing protein [Arthrobacter]|uniref:DUF1003 domain-containing protein n=2 Tax=Arthrobacter TaxID=1663 RepID=A0ABU9KKV6_9MICC|nr:DUF1003 domain-containing protein [Arthrobacter sp. YJM1]MDP5227142.1 DUF1003 domain-containing protein [Arthrobacter sp. YJM1]